MHGYSTSGALAEAAPRCKLGALGGVRAHHHEQHSERLSGVLQQRRAQRTQFREFLFTVCEAIVVLDFNFLNKQVI